MEYRLTLQTPAECEIIEAKDYEEAIKISGEIARDYLSSLSSWECYEVKEVGQNI